MRWDRRKEAHAIRARPITPPAGDLKRPLAGNLFWNSPELSKADTAVLGAMIAGAPHKLPR